MQLTTRFLPLFLLALPFLWTSCSDDETVIPGEFIITENIDDDRILEDRVDNPNQPDYVIDGDITVYGELSIEPGVVIEFEANSSLIIEVEGSIVADGTTSKPIVMTGVAKTPGFWKGVLVYSPKITNVLHNVTISYAGGAAVSDIWFDIKANLAVDAYSPAKISLTNCTFSHSAGLGVAIDENAIIQAFSNNTFSDNADAAMRCDAVAIAELDGGSSFTGSNGFNGVEIVKTFLNEQTDLTWPALKDAAPYRVLGDIELKSGVYVEPGAIFQFDPVRMLTVEVDGFFNAIGTASQPIVFTGSVTSAPSWKGILFFSPSVLNKMDHCEVAFAGSDPINDIWLDFKTNIGLDNYADAKLELTNSIIRNGDGCGVYVDSGATLTQSGNTFSNLAAGDICP